MVGPRVVKITLRRRKQSRQPARRSTRDPNPILVGQPLRDQEPRGVDAVVHIDDAPVAVQAHPIHTAVTGRAAVVDVDDAESAAGPVLILEGVSRTRRPSWSPVAPHPEPRPFLPRPLPFPRL